MTKRKNITLCFIALLLLAISCSPKEIQDFKDLLPLRDSLIEEYKVDDLSVSIMNGNGIGVTFVNSSFDALSRAEKEAKAKEIARFVNKHYVSIKNMDMISVSFVVHKDYIIFNYTNNTNNFFFQPDQFNTAIDSTHKNVPQPASF